jgi:hypothetical protein
MVPLMVFEGGRGDLAGVERVMRMLTIPFEILIDRSDELEATADALM